MSEAPKLIDEDEVRERLERQEMAEGASKLDKLVERVNEHPDEYLPTVEVMRVPVDGHEDTAKTVGALTLADLPTVGLVLARKPWGGRGLYRVVVRYKQGARYAGRLLVSVDTDLREQPAPEPRPAPAPHAIDENKLAGVLNGIMQRLDTIEQRAHAPQPAAPMMHAQQPAYPYPPPAPAAPPVDAITLMKEMSAMQDRSMEKIAEIFGRTTKATAETPSGTTKDLEKMLHLGLDLGKAASTGVLHMLLEKHGGDLVAIPKGALELGEKLLNVRGKEADVEKVKAQTELERAKNTVEVRPAQTAATDPGAVLE